MAVYKITVHEIDDDDSFTVSATDSADATRQVDALFHDSARPHVIIEDLNDRISTGFLTGPTDTLPPYDITQIADYLRVSAIQLEDDLIRIYS